MAAARKEPENPSTRRPPATTPEARERQLISLAFDLVEKKLIAGTASAQETVHFLKLGSEREKLEREKLKLEATVLTNRAEQISSGKRMEELYGEAIEAMRGYQGMGSSNDSYDD